MIKGEHEPLARYIRTLSKELHNSKYWWFLASAKFLVAGESWKYKCRNKISSLQCGFETWVDSLGVKDEDNSIYIYLVVMISQSLVTWNIIGGDERMHKKSLDY